MCRRSRRERGWRGGWRRDRDGGETDDGREHIEGRDEVEDDGHVDEGLIGAAVESLIWLRRRKRPERPP